MAEASDIRLTLQRLFVERANSENGGTASLSEQLAGWIGERILRGVIAPGDHVTEQAVAAEFSVSRGPVREAFRILEREGLLDLHPRRGASASLLSRSDVLQIFDVRTPLQSAVARQLALRRTDALLSDWDGHLARMAALAGEAGGHREFLQAVMELSTAMLRSIGNPRLFDALTRLALQLYRYALLGLQSPEQRMQAVALWRELIEAIRQGDANRAEQTAVRISERSRDQALRVLPPDDGPVLPAGSGPPVS